MTHHVGSDMVDTVPWHSPGKKTGVGSHSLFQSSSLTSAPRDHVGDKRKAEVQGGRVAVCHPGPCHSGRGGGADWARCQTKTN